ncbi:MAG: hypothetical protein ACRCVT_01430 [Leadbetterella sp.]
MRGYLPNYWIGNPSLSSIDMWKKSKSGLSYRQFLKRESLEQIKINEEVLYK